MPEPTRPGDGPPADPTPPPAGPVRRGRPGWLGTAAVLCAGVVLLTAGWAGRRDEPVGDRTVGEVTRVGVRQGDAIPEYVRTAGAELAALPTDGPSAYALVSFDGYLAPGRLPVLLADTAVVEVVTRVPLPDRQTEVVHLPAQLLPQDVVAGMSALADRKDREAADQRTRAAGATDVELRRVYDSGAQVAAGEARAYRSGCGCVYAAVVRADPVALRALAARPGVRVVDPAPEVRRLDRTVFTPPLPEQRDVVRPPVDAALVPTGPPVGDSSEAAPGVIGSSPAASVGAGAPAPAPTS
ncbi:hypothetical protein [Micromonospora halophytica]|uniref:Uncharacterized protein n=1 Tax=Micromonospora halophytica TaxID=47864 RepID=A0A1C5GV17_9ACTN|nr:hypothetical protein [Micromonospora halophytica]SCG37573.1 hypothetical protein GA0070560_102135 [Micromonospora halophytica]